MAAFFALLEALAGHRISCRVVRPGFRTRNFERMESCRIVRPAAARPDMVPDRPELEEELPNGPGIGSRQPGCYTQGSERRAMR